MRRRSRSALIVAASALAFVSAGAQAAPAPTSLGYTYRFRTTNRTTSGALGDAESFIAGRVRTQSGNVRIEFDSMSIADPLITPGGYLIVRAGGKRLQIVDPAQRRYLDVDADSLGLAGGNMGDVMGLELSEPVIVAESLGVAPAVLGRETKRFRLTAEFSATASVMGQKLIATTKAVNDFWTTPSIRGIPDAGEVMARIFGRGPGTAGTELIAKLAAARARLTSELALRSASRTTLTVMDRATEMESTNEVTELREGAIDDAAFRVPAGYTKVDLDDIMGAATPSESPPAARPPTKRP
jgi:hypothetical protein